LSTLKNLISRLLTSISGIFRTPLNRSAIRLDNWLSATQTTSCAFLLSITLPASQRTVNIIPVDSIVIDWLYFDVFDAVISVGVVSNDRLKSV
jgi:hypothetical protein